jgi:predicted transcriptional regulator
MTSRKITEFGWKIKKELIERRMDQKEFCRLYNIPESRLSNIICGTRPATKYRKRIAELLNIEEGERTEGKGRQENAGHSNQS